MIRKLRIKIILVISVILTLAVFVVMMSINYVASKANQNEIESNIRSIADREGNHPPSFDPFDPYADSSSGFSDYICVWLTDTLEENYKMVQIKTSRDDIVIETDDIIEYTKKALNSGETFGEIGNYEYYIRTQKFGKLIVFMDIKPFQQSNRNLLKTTSLIGISTILALILLSIFLSKWLVKPVKITFDKQKRFISDASHELKTPIAVISANSDVLEAEIGENKWLSYIKGETSRMSELVSELLCLARIDDKSGRRPAFEEFSLSDVFLQTVLPFESNIYEIGKTLEVDAQPDIKYKGDVSAIKHIITILVDNAIKYSDEHGHISLKLYTHGSKKIIEVYNTGQGVPKDKLNKIFERFYRQDEARDRSSGGYGLGLAIAKANAEVHGGKITAQSEPGKWIKFTVTL